MRCVSSRFLTAPPRLSEASINSAANLRGIDFHRACAPHRSPSASPTPCAAMNALRPAPDKSRHRRGAISPRPQEPHCRAPSRRDPPARLLFADLVKRAVDDFFGDRFLATLHHHVDEAGNHLDCRASDPAAGASWSLTFSRHISCPNTLVGSGPVTAVCAYDPSIKLSAAWRRTSNGSDDAW